MLTGKYFMSLTAEPYRKSFLCTMRYRRIRAREDCITFNVLRVLRAHITRLGSRTVSRTALFLYLLPTIRLHITSARTYLIHHFLKLT